MRQKIILLVLLTFIFGVNAQENKLFSELIKHKGSEDQVSFIMNLPFSNLDNNTLILKLKNKLNSELNSIKSCLNSLIDSESLGLTEREVIELRERLINISSEFYKSDRYTLLKSSGGYAPSYGVGLETISDKKVMIVHLGGDCSIDKRDLKRNEMISIFNKQMEKLIFE